MVKVGIKAHQKYDPDIIRIQQGGLDCGDRVGLDPEGRQPVLGIWTDGGDRDHLAYVARVLLAQGWDPPRHVLRDWPLLPGYVSLLAAAILEPRQVVGFEMNPGYATSARATLPFTTTPC